jgi:phage-related protein
MAMGQSYFIWNGIDSRAQGIMLRRAAPLIRPEERVKHTTIPGLSGDLTEIEGEHVYNSYIQTIEMSVRYGTQVKAIFDWLRGAGYVTFSGDPDKRQQARVIGAVTLEKVSRNMDHWSGSVQFYCQPLKQRIYDIAETMTAAGTIRNNGDVACRPIILATPGSGASTMDITVNGKTLTLTGVDGIRRIDCQAQEITNAEKTALYTVKSGGPFPVLEQGVNEISGSGWARLDIYKNERFL